MELTPRQALGLRMSSLLLRASPGGSGRATGVAEVVTWLGAMQAQDLASGLWSFGARLPGSTAADVTAALERREALRTWPMRGTIHFVPSRDARWMLELMSVRVLNGAARRREQLGLSERTTDEAMEVLGAALAGGGRLSRSQCLAVLADKGIDPSGQRGYHLLGYASQRGLLCIAPNIGNEQSFVLLDEWVPDPHRPERDEALGVIALRYFRGRGPTTRHDFAGWTGLTAADAKRGIAVAGDALARVTVDGSETYLDAALLYTAPPPADDDEILVLPGFDEYLLGYKDRSLMVADEHKAAIIPGGNGVFQSTVVRAGRVVATWRRTLTKSRVLITVQPLVPLHAGDRAKIEQAFEPYARFIERTLEARWP
ncbi:winged helix DNA-binding domain-containing protein [Sphaerisporangium sp. TRM90804]|uniref:winged helix DNA-binding domain-containing protein n=1 Tax=Sphaerisporangium sp. TRM90804 TaxID=3031113 RepID=UPI00244AAE8B|nr:winged helix DNA-binding domain-containing protein [Sphaerisporangium sp. TRM90804]MDH2428290.1 winged helix DNA-binding domain-containing protein [Sphaerisporangium sp. TRM90804]